MSLLDAFPKDYRLEPEFVDPLRLLPKKLRTLIMVYKAGVESGLIEPKGVPAEPETPEVDEQ